MSDSPHFEPNAPGSVPSSSAPARLAAGEPIKVPSRRAARRARRLRPLIQLTKTVLLVVLAVTLAMTPIFVRRYSQDWNLPWLDHVPDFFLLHPLVTPLAPLGVFAVVVFVATRRNRLGRRLRMLNPWKVMTVIIVLTFLAGAALYALAPASAIVDDDPFEPASQLGAISVQGVGG